MHLAPARSAVPSLVRCWPVVPAGKEDDVAAVHVTQARSQVDGVDLGATDLEPVRESDDLHPAVVK